MGAPGTDRATSTQPATAGDNSTHTYRYPSWVELCKPSGHVYPTFEDVVVSINYGNTPLTSLPTG